MPPTVTETTRDGYPAVALAAGDLTATFVPQLGMVGAGLEHRGEELLGQRGGLAAYEAKGSTMGIPLLHPWANRLASTGYQVAGTKVEIGPDAPRLKRDPNGLPIHGLLTANPNWEVTERQPEDVTTADLRARFDFGAQPELLESFPFPHTIELHAALNANGLTIETTVTAPPDSPVPIAFGFHPYLALPNVQRADWHVELPATTHLLLDDRGIPTGATEPAPAAAGPLGQTAYDDLYADLPEPPTFVLQGAGRRIEVTFTHGYPYAQVYAPPDQDLICFEPMTAPTNALATNELTVLEPGGRYSAAFSIAVKPA